MSARNPLGVAPASVTPSTASALEASLWVVALEDAGYHAVAQRTRMSYTDRSSGQLWYVVTDAPVAGVAAMLLEVTPGARQPAVKKAGSLGNADGEEGE